LLIQIYEEGGRADLTSPVQRGEKGWADIFFLLILEKKRRLEEDSILYLLKSSNLKEKRKRGRGGEGERRSKQPSYLLSLIKDLFERRRRGGKEIILSYKQLIREKGKKAKTRPNLNAFQTEGGGKGEKVFF